MEGKEPVYTVNGSVVKNYADAGNPDQDLSKNGYRLPLDIEWEYAARGGDPSDTVNWNYTYPGSDNVDEVAWHSGNLPDDWYVGEPVAVGQKKPNSAGLYDMGGNAWEWVWDRFSPIEVDTPLTGPAGSGRTKRGGGVSEGPYGSSVLWRWSVNTDQTSADLSFRVVSR
jgi:formylglycine-generating enzyme required for sulfatase activity